VSDGPRETPGAPAGRRGRGRVFLAVYLVLLAASHVARFLTPDSQAPSDVLFAAVPAVARDTPTGGTLRLAYLRWDPPPDSPAPQRPVILLHGSPGSARDFERLGPMLAASGRAVLSVDQPGFGHSTQGVADRSLRSAARAVLGLMDALEIPQAHIVGWSNGGGTALNMADLDPDRLASLTMMASIGVQETEGSGNYHFEHFKYAVGYTVTTAIRELVPHFGLLDGLSFIQNSMLNFWETDQRPLEAIMQRLQTPTLILHGRDDFLTSAWGAERHHQVIPSSRLVMLDASHFIPFLQAEEATLHLSLFLRQVEAGEIVEREAFYLEDPPYSNPLGDWGERAETAVRATPWWAILLVIAAATLASPLLAVVICGYFVGRHTLDLALAMTGISAGFIAEAGILWLLGCLKGHAASKLPLVRSRVGLLSGRVSEIDWSRRLGLLAGGPAQRPLRLGIASRFQPWIRSQVSLASGVLRFASARLLAGIVLGSLLWAVVMMIAASAMTAPLAGALGSRFEGAWGYAATLAGAAAAIPILNILQHVLTWTGRKRALARLSRTRRYEFWPSWVFYLPLVPWFAWLSLRHGGPMTFSCANPGIEGGGGIIGESKAGIIGNLGHSPGHVLEAHLVPAGPTPQKRALVVKRLLDQHAGLRADGPGGLPVILKPDGGQRGHAVKLARDHDEVLAYFQDMTRDAVVQRYHPGPRECGVMWVRDVANLKSQISNLRSASPGTGASADGKTTTGFIFSITRKEFPVVTGDGRRTLEELIYSHPRLRCQSRAFFTRFADDRSRVLAEGETLRLAMAGNHCQGTLFLDGADLITPALAGAIDEIARGFPSGAGGGLDFGRFDLRYESDELLKSGRGFGIVELNGTTSESTNLYDPTKGILWAYGVLFRQWAALFRIGGARRGAGARPMSLRTLAASLRGFYRARPGSSVSD
jgi:pimeloyl-ACP methyl ester carboxylesterase